MEERFKSDAIFEKVSFEQFEKDLEQLGNLERLNRNDIRKIYNEIKMPSISSNGSAGEDFYSPYNIHLKQNQSYIIATGLRCKMNNNLVMQIYPRSSYGIKYNMQLLNTVAIIDSDYYYAKNEGHIMIAIKNNCNNDLIINKGDRFCQAVFVHYYHSSNIIVNNNSRSGGIGSSGR